MSLSLILEESYFQTMSCIVVPALETIQKAFQLTRPDGHIIFGKTYCLSKCKGSILISHGFSESSAKYQELIYYFLKEGYSVCILDHRGHGQSRDGKVGQIPTHVEHFQDYVEDLSAVVEAILKKQFPAPYYLFAHSMGGMIGACFLEQHPGDFSKAVLNAPMFEINRGSLPYFAAKILVNLPFKDPNRLMFGQGYFNPRMNFQASAATSRPRYLWYFRQQQADPYLQNSGTSIGWVKEGFTTGEQAIQDSGKITIPLLLFQAERDDYVMASGHTRFMEHVPNGRLIPVPNSKHEIYLSENAVLEPYLLTILNFLEG